MVIKIGVQVTEIHKNVRHIGKSKPEISYGGTCTLLIPTRNGKGVVRTHNVGFEFPEKDVTTMQEFVRFDWMEPKWVLDAGCWTFDYTHIRACIKQYFSSK